MDLFWYVATLWVLVGLVATVLAIWVGGSLRDEFVRASKGIRMRQKPLRLIRGGRTRVVGRHSLRPEPRELLAVRAAAHSID